MNTTDAIRLYLNHQHMAGLSPYTSRGAKSALKELNDILISQDIQEVDLITHDALMPYRETIAFRLTRKGQPLGIRSQGTLIGHVRAFFRWLHEQGHLLYDPSERLIAPKKPRPLPKSILEIKEVEHLFSLPDTSTPRGFRNRLVMEVLYSTGIRCAEVVGVQLVDVNLEDGYLMIRRGKGQKDRVVPLARVARDRMQSYLIDVRPSWVKSEQEQHVFLNRWGEGMSIESMSAIVRKYGRLSGINKVITTHTFRHTCATHMIRNGAPIRHVQEMLGHESLETTQIYTRVTINDLMAAHKKYHPSEQEV